jgi:hypothetical protein
MKSPRMLCCDLLDPDKRYRYSYKPRRDEGKRKSDDRKSNNLNYEDGDASEDGDKYIHA